MLLGDILTGFNCVGVSAVTDLGFSGVVNVNDVEQVGSTLSPDEEHLSGVFSKSDITASQDVSRTR